MIYSVIDIETTGGSHGNRITEIAVIKTDGSAVLDTYHSLINPEVFIPKSISLLTGITNDMVDAAPRFHEVADELLQFIDQTIFVAHNVSFDYSIIKNHYEDCRKSFNQKKLCTVRLAKHVLPGYDSYSLGKLCRSLNIDILNRHRAMGDAEATVKVLQRIIEADESDFIGHSLNKQNRETTLPPNLSKEEFESVPESPGVYYLLGQHLEKLYIGKAKNMRQRITTHFTEKTRKKSELLRKIHHVSYTETGNELIALLLEADEIKRHFPPYNRAQKFGSNNYHVCYYEGQDGLLRVDVFLKKYASKSLQEFTSMVAAKDFLYRLVEKEGLCPKFAGLEKRKERCFLGDSCDLCNQKVSIEEYNQRVIAVKELFEKKNLLILGYGRSEEEKAVVSVVEGQYAGFGFVHQSEAHHLESLQEAVKPYRNTKDTQRIIKQFLNGKPGSQYQVMDLSLSKTT